MNSNRPTLSLKAGQLANVSEALAKLPKLRELREVRVEPRLPAHKLARARVGTPATEPPMQITLAVVKAMDARHNSATCPFCLDAAWGSHEG